jgi:hypothetical protein
MNSSTVTHTKSHFGVCMRYRTTCYKKAIHPWRKTAARRSLLASASPWHRDNLANLFSQGGGESKIASWAVSRADVDRRSARLVPNSPQHQKRLDHRPKIPSNRPSLFAFTSTPFFPLSPSLASFDFQTTMIKPSRSTATVRSHTIFLHFFYIFYIPQR